MPFLSPYLSRDDFIAGYSDRAHSSRVILGSGNGASLALTVGDAYEFTPSVTDLEVIFPLSLAVAPLDPVWVNYATRDGTARARYGDYVSLKGQALFLPGQTMLAIRVSTPINYRFATTQFFLDAYWPSGSSHLVTRRTGTCFLSPPRTVDTDQIGADATLFTTDGS
jgi:hypothetical protein